MSADLPADLADVIARARWVEVAALAEVDQLKAAALHRAREFGIQLRDGVDYEGIWYPVEPDGDSDER